MSWWNPRSRDPKRDFSLPHTPERLDAEVEEEFRFHIEERRVQLIAEGMSPEQARAEVARRFGDEREYRRMTRTIDAQALRENRRAEFFGTLWRETRHSARVLPRQKGFSLVAVLTLALGIGATTAMYAVLDAVVLSPLPYPAPDRLVSVLHPATVPGSGERRWGLSPGGYIHFARENTTLSDFGIYQSFSGTITSGGDAEVAQFARATHGVLGAFRARAALGRVLDANDDKPGAPQVAVLSHEFFERRFGGDPRVIGTMLQTTDAAYEIVGVTQPNLALPMPGPFADASNLAGFHVDAWLPFQIDPAGPFWNNHPNVGIGRLKDGVSIEAANAEFAAMLARFPEQMPRAYSTKFITQYNFRVQLKRLRDSVLGESVPRTLWMLFGSVLLVLVIATANVGNLFLVRMEARRRESAVRAALGADRRHMAAHYLSESFLICGTAALAALAIAAGVVKLLLAIAPGDVPRLWTVSIGVRGVVVTLAIGLLLGLVLGVIPLFRRGLDIDTLRDGSRGLSASPRQRLARNGLVVGQIALTVMLLTAASLLLRSFSQLRNVRPGFDPAHTLAFEVSLPFSEFDTREKALVFYRAFTDRVRALPGVVAVGGGAVPLQDFGTGCSVVFREGLPYAPGEETPCVSTPTALPGYFEALGIAVNGRIPDWGDVDRRSQAVVVTRALADRLWPGETPIGKRIGSNGPDSDVWYQVVGTVELLRAEALDAPPTEGVFYAASGLRANARTDAINDMTLFVRTGGTEPTSLVPTLRALVRELNPRTPFISPRTMDQVVARSMARVTFSLVLLALAGGMGLVLSAVGLYGVVSYVVTQRRAEIGIRMALGADSSSVLRLVVLQSLRLAAVGIVIGVVGALAASRALQAMLFEVRATDPTVLAGVAMLLFAIVTLASWGPARRAARIDPSEAMQAS